MILEKCDFFQKLYFLIFPPLFVHRDCQSDFTTGGNKSSKAYYQDLLKSVSRAQGDYWLDLTSRDYAKFASYSFEHRPNVGVNGNFQPGFMNSEKMAFDKYLGK